MKKTAVVILNYNGKKFLEDFLPLVIEKSMAVADVWVADNNSTDSSVEMLNEKFPQVKVLINKKNGGYATGYNQALKQIEAEYYVLLNSDIEVTDNWIEPVIELMESDERIAACQPKILSFYEKEKFEYAGAAGGFIDKYGYPFCRGRLFQSLETDSGQYDDAMEVFWASGACMFVRSKVFHESGGLDDDFYVALEVAFFSEKIQDPVALPVEGFLAIRLGRESRARPVAKVLEDFFFEHGPVAADEHVPDDVHWCESDPEFDLVAPPLLLDSYVVAQT